MSIRAYTTAWAWLMAVLLLYPAMGAEKDLDWTVVIGKRPTYLKLEEKEVVLRGTLIVENYGKPGVNYFRAPHNYWLQTEGEKISLAFNDGIFPRFDKKAVEAKGKRQKRKDGSQVFHVGWIREVAELKDAPNAKEAKRAATTSQPNIIVILVDDMGYADVSCYGDDQHVNVYIARQIEKKDICCSKWLIIQ